LALRLAHSRFSAGNTFIRAMPTGSHPATMTSKAGRLMRAAKGRGEP
jgi:hypothetical protein